MADAAPARVVAQKKSLRAAEQDRLDVAKARDRWRTVLPFMNAGRFVFLDETGVSTKMVRPRGWALKGDRLVDAAPFGHWQTTTFLAGLRANGIVAPLVLSGPMKGRAFKAYVKQFLVPVLPPGDVVVMDNLPAHEVAGVREAIEEAGASLVYLPPYSPDSNPTPSSRRSCARPPPAPATSYGIPSLVSSTPSRRPNAETTSQTAAMRTSRSKML